MGKSIFNYKNASFRIFFFLFFLFLALGLILNLSFSQKEIFFWVNRNNSPFLDNFTRYFTYAGDGITAIIIGILTLLFIKIRHGFAILAGYALEGIVVQILKRLVFTDRPRPWAKYEHTDFVHLVSNFKPYSNNSFPSGHTATAFCLAALAVLIWPQLKAGWLWIIPALLVAYSRIYLSQHYFIDIYAGAITGVLAALPVYYYFYSQKQNPTLKNTWLDRPLLKL
jgi:membrane-associated phospholipid phosphatase